MITQDIIDSFVELEFRFTECKVMHTIRKLMYINFYKAEIFSPRHSLARRPLPTPNTEQVMVVISLTAHYNAHQCGCIASCSDIPHSDAHVPPGRHYLPWLRPHHTRRWLGVALQCHQRGTGSGMVTRSNFSLFRYESVFVLYFIKRTGIWNYGNINAQYYITYEILNTEFSVSNKLQLELSILQRNII